MKSLLKWNGWLLEKNIWSRTFCAILKDSLPAVHCQRKRTFPVSTREVSLGVVLLNGSVNGFDLSLGLICKIYGWLPASQILNNTMKIQNVWAKLDRWFDVNNNKVVQGMAKCCMLERRNWMHKGKTGTHCLSRITPLKGLGIITTNWIRVRNTMLL